MVGVIDVRESRELQAVIFAMKRVRREVRLEVYAQTRKVLVPEWQAALFDNASTALEGRALVQGARIKVGTQGFQGTAGTSRRALRGGFKPAQLWHAAEFGAERHRKTIDTHSPKGTPYTVTKTINKGLRPRNKDGYVVMPAAREIGSRMVSLWVQTVVRVFRDAAEGK